MVQNQKLFVAQGQHGTSALFVVAKLHFESTRTQMLDHGTDLSPARER